MDYGNNRIALRNGGTEWGWLRNAAYSTVFANCSAGGYANLWSASDSGGVRPVFIVKI